MHTGALCLFRGINMLNKNEIKFRPDGKLIVMQVSDPQDMKYVRKAMVKMLDNAYDLIKPDLVVFTGDNILGNHLRDYRFSSKKKDMTREEEFEIMKTHTTRGYALLNMLDGIDSENQYFKYIIIIL